MKRNVRFGFSYWPVLVLMTFDRSSLAVFLDFIYVFQIVKSTKRAPNPCKPEKTSENALISFVFYTAYGGFGVPVPIVLLKSTDIIIVRKHWKFGGFFLNIIFSK